jgi:hypothetical protein
MHFIGDLSESLFWVAGIPGAIALFSHNKLQRLSQEIREKAADVQPASVGARTIQP